MHILFMCWCPNAACREKKEETGRHVVSNYQQRIQPGEVNMATIEKREYRDKNGKKQTKYRVKIRIKGRPSVSATFDRLTDARKWVTDTERDIRNGLYFKNKEAEKHTLTDAITRYKRDILPTKGSQKDNQSYQLDWWNSELGDYLLADIGGPEINECRDKLLSERTHQSKTRSGSTVNRYLSALSHVFSIAVTEWYWLDENPFKSVRRPKENKARNRYLEQDEIKSLLNACKTSRYPHLYTIVVLALSTGARRGEIMSLTWKDVDMNNHRITLHNTKNGDTRSLPLVSHAHELVEKLPRRIDSKLIFPGSNPAKPKDLRYVWYSAVDKAKLTGFRFHDLRHTAASYLAMNSASLVEIAEILGHRTLQMVKRYAHLSDQHRQEAVKRMNTTMFG